MLVVEYRHRPPAFRKHPGDLLEEMLPGIQMPPPFIPGIIAMLTDQQDRIHIEFV